MTITAIQEGTNADLINTARRLYPMDGSVLDLTPGTKDGFWRGAEPRGLVRLARGVDFRATGLGAGSWDHVVFDPPYVTPGGRATSTIGEMNGRYGMQDTEATPWEQWNTQIVPGLYEARRLLGNYGLLWFKCADYVSSGKVHWFTKHALAALDQAGFTLVDEFILNGHPRAQPLTNPDGTLRRQVHARRAHSNLLIAKPRRRPREST